MIMEEPEISPIAADQEAADVHTSKIAPDDPRLKIDAAKQSRSLKKGPVIAIAGGTLGVIIIAMIVALSPQKKAEQANEKKETPASQTITIPENIRQAPGNNVPVNQAMSNREEVPQLGPPLPGDLGHSMVNPQGGGGRGPNRYGNYQRPQAGKFNSQAPDPVETEKLAAIKASPFFGGGNGRTQPAPSASSGGSGLSVGQQPVQLALPAEPDQNMQSKKNEFFANGGGDDKEYVSKSLKQPISKYEIKAGTVIPVVLVTSINSDLPGNVVGMVNESVYDSRTGEHLLIPQGTRVLGRYSSEVSYGQNRVQVSWVRMIRPDGSSIVLDQMPGVDLSGSTGYADKVNNHYGRLAGGIVLSSILSGAATLSQGSYDYQSQTVEQRMAANVGNNISSVGNQMAAKNLNIQPTIEIRAGKKVNIMVNKDFVLSPYTGND